MGPFILLVLSASFAASFAETPNIKTEKTLLSTALKTSGDDTKKTLQRQGRSYYYGPLYDRLVYGRDDYDIPSRCGRCDDRYDSERSRDRYDDDRGLRHRPTYGSRHDRNRNDDDDDDRNDRHSSNDGNSKKNGTNDDSNPDSKRPSEDDDRPSSGRKGGDRHRDRGRDRYDDRDRYRPDYYDRFLRDPYRERRPYYDDRRAYDRIPHDEGYGGRYDGYGYPGYRRPYSEDRYERGNGYDDAYGGYGPGVGRGPHDSFRPWDETYRGQAGWDAGGRGYYFAGGRPEPAPAPAPAAQGWARPEYGSSSSGWQSVGYRDPLEYRGSVGYAPESGYRQGVSATYGASSGWHNVGERRPYRDQSGVSQYDKGYGQSWNDVRYGESDAKQPTYGQGYGSERQPLDRPGYGGRPSIDNRQPAYSSTDVRQPSYGSDSRQPSYGSSDRQPGYGESRPTSGYGQYGTSDRQGSYGSYGNGDRQSSYPSYPNSDRQYGQVNSDAIGYGKSSTTPATSYLYQREDEQVTTKAADEVTTKQPA